MQLNILVLPGDGIGTEVTREAVRVLERVAAKYHHTLNLTEGLLGGIAIHKTGQPMPEETARLAQEADATLLGAVGLPEFDNAPPSQRPERGLLGIRKALGVYANLRPVRTYKALIDSSPLKNERVAGTDMIIVRELTGGIYYGTPRGIEGEGAEERAVNTMTYSRAEIARIGRMAFHLARNRRKKLASVDKSNVLETSQLWRKVMVEVAADYPDVELEHVLVDNCAMQLVLNPTRFDVVVTENMFGDILSDEGAVLAGSIGMLPSASIGDQKPSGAWVASTNRSMVRPRISPARTRPTRWARLEARRQCLNTASACSKRPRPSTGRSKRCSIAAARLRPETARHSADHRTGRPRSL